MALLSLTAKDRYSRLRDVSGVNGNRWSARAVSANAARWLRWLHEGGRKGGVAPLDFLETGDFGPRLSQPLEQSRQTSFDAIDVECGELHLMDVICKRPDFSSTPNLTPSSFAGVQARQREWLVERGGK